MTSHRRFLVVLAALTFGVSVALSVSACSSSSTPIDDIPKLPEATTAQVKTLLAASDQPVVLNVWASWCGPCRSEAPLLRMAAEQWGSEVRFVGIDVRDDQDGARAFIAEFGLTGLEHLADPAGGIPLDLGGSRGVPLTFFFAPGGEMVDVHFGVIDERTLALQIDEIIRAGG